MKQFEFCPDGLKWCFSRVSSLFEQDFDTKKCLLNFWPENRLSTPEVYRLCRDRV